MNLLKHRALWKVLTMSTMLFTASLTLAACDTQGTQAPLTTPTLPASRTQAPSPVAVVTLVPTAFTPTDAAPSQPTATQAGTTIIASTGGTVGATPSVKAEQPVAPEQNPAGDIPDTQAFVMYSSAAGGYQFEAPEGWSRTEKGTDVNFSDKLNAVTLAVTSAGTQSTAASAKDNQVAAIQNAGRAVTITAVKDVTLPSGPAVLIEYTSNSEPNAVTGKQVRLENNAYLIYKRGTLATMTLSAPLGADNVDQWNRMSRSFTWR